MRIQCDQCQAAMINHVFCHEHGCANSRKQWRDDQWVKISICNECGCEIADGEECNCISDTEEETK